MFNSMGCPNTLFEVDFTIFANRERWPVAANLVFIADAIEQLADAIWNNDDPELNAIREEIEVYDAPPERSGILWTMVKLFEGMLVSGSITAFGRPIDGEGTSILRDYVWDSSKTLAAVARGFVFSTGSDGTKREHWIFLDRVEFELLMLLYSPAGHDDDPFGNLKRRHDLLVEVVRDNLPAIARSRSATLPTRVGPGYGRKAFADDPTFEEFEEMFADARRVLEAKHQIALEIRIANWLIARFDDNSLRYRDREHFTAIAKAAFEPYGTEEHLRRAWTLAIRERPKRFKAGRPKRQARPGDQTSE